MAVVDHAEERRTGALVAEFLGQAPPVTGLNDHPEVLAYHRLIFMTPALATRLYQFIAADQTALAEALTEVWGDDLEAELTAAQLISTQQVLSRRNWLALSTSTSANAQYATAVDEATRAYGRLTTRVDL